MEQRPAGFAFHASNRAASAHHADELSENANLVRLHNHRLDTGIGRQKFDLFPSMNEALERYFAIYGDGGDFRPLDLRLLPYDREIPVLDVIPDHALAVNTQSKDLTPSEGFATQIEIPFKILNRLDGTSRGNSAKDGNPRGRSLDDPDAARRSTPALDVTLTLERLQVVLRRADRDLQRAGNLPNGRRISVACDFLRNELENLSLPRSQILHG